MQVRDLIEELKRFNPDAKVEVRSNWDFPCPIVKIKKLGSRNAVVIQGEKED